MRPTGDPPSSHICYVFWRCMSKEGKEVERFWMKREDLVWDTAVGSNPSCPLYLLSHLRHHHPHDDLPALEQVASFAGGPPLFVVAAPKWPAAAYCGMACYDGGTLSCCIKATDRTGLHIHFTGLLWNRYFILQISLYKRAYLQHF